MDLSFRIHQFSPSGLITPIKIFIFVLAYSQNPEGCGDVGRHRSGSKDSFLNLHTHEMAFSTPPLTWTEISLNKTVNPNSDKRFP